MMPLRLSRNLYNVPLLVTQERAAEIERYVKAREEGGTLLHGEFIARDDPPKVEMLAPGQMRADAGYIRTDQDVAIIQVIGTLVQRGDSMDAQSGLIGYNRLSNQISAAMNDPRITAIMFEIASPGGEANGILALLEQIRAAGQRKPTASSANERALSGGFWMGAAAQTFTAPTTATVGSIGVLMLHVDQSQRDAKQGLVYTPIIAGARKTEFSSHAPLSDAARTAAQEEVDRLYEMFTSDVANLRGITQQEVINTEAALLNPHKALSVGLIDGVQSFDDALLALADEGRKARHYGMRVAAKVPASILEGEDTMDPKATATGAPTPATAAEIASAVTNALTAGATADQAARTESEKAAKALVDAQAAGKIEGQTAGATAERVRINSILTHAEAKDRAAMAQHLAFNTSMTVDEAGALLKVSAKETTAKTTNLFAAHMEQQGNPKIVADAVAGDLNADDMQMLASVVQMRNKAHGAPAK